MTTAHRPTWNPAKGGNDQGGNRCLLPSRQFSAKDAPAHTKIKYRQPGQGSKTEQDQADYKKHLLEAEINAIFERKDEEKVRSASEEEFEEEELLREVEKIRAERMQKKEEEARVERVREEQQKLIEENLIETAPGYSLKRKWNEETVFKNQASKEPKSKRTFINDTLRSQKHKDFIRKVIH